MWVEVLSVHIEFQFTLCQVLRLGRYVACTLTIICLKSQSSKFGENSWLYVFICSKKLTVSCTGKVTFVLLALLSNYNLVVSGIACWIEKSEKNR